MPSPPRDLSRAITIINRFTLQHSGEHPDTEFARAAEILREHPDLDFIVRVRLARRQDVVVQLSYWQSHAGFVNAVRQPGFADQLERLRSVVLETHADQAVRVTQVIPPQGCWQPRPAFGILTDYLVAGDRPAFERAARDQADRYQLAPGFGGFDLLRSTLRPRRYLSISWWYDADHCAAAVSGDRTGGLAGAAVVRVEQTGRIAYERPTGTG